MFDANNTDWLGTLAMKSRVLVLQMAVTALALLGSAQSGLPQSASGTQGTVQTPTQSRGVIKGRVYAADTRRPLRRARVTLTSTVLNGTLMTTSDDRGEYEFADLATGRYQVIATRTGYLRGELGQKGVRSTGRPVELPPNGALTEADILLIRAATLTGHVGDEVGDPLQHVAVAAMQVRYSQGRRQLVQVGYGDTDSSGSFRILDLRPGDYWLVGTTSETWVVRHANTEEFLAYSPTYYPGSTNAAEAHPVRVAIGREVTDVDFRMVPGKAVAVTGRALDSAGSALSGTTVYLSQQFSTGTGGLLKMMSSAVVRDDGGFHLERVPTGHYVLAVRAAPKDGRGFEAAAMSVAVDDEVTGLTVITSPGATIHGTIETETGANPTVQTDRLRLVARSSDELVTPLAPNADSGRPTSDWRFSLSGIFGRVLIRPSILPDGWRLVGVYADGKDVTDTPIDAHDVGESSVKVVVSDHANLVTGVVQDGRGNQQGDYTAIAFAVDDRKWGPDSRFVRAARPDQSGVFKLSGLPSGTYLIVAVNDVEPGAWTDPDFLATVRSVGTEFTVSDDDQKSLTLVLQETPR
jgi:hypothetical protein